MTLEEKHPILISGHQHVAKLIVRHYHEKVGHQGRHFTEGAIRAAGYWITGMKRIIANLLYNCVKCRRLRGPTCHQQMAELPEERVKPSPPFSFVGVDMCGPWEVTTRRTRGGAAHWKRWAALFTCLGTRAVHIEVVEEMSASSFINALRRFTAIRGSVKEYRSDRGTNFVGGTRELQMDTINIEDGLIKGHLSTEGSVWKFNPPHASHMGGSWERMIGMTRKILDSMLHEHKGPKLTHEVLTTLMAEISSIINARPLVPVSTDPESPFILSPSVLLTQKITDTPDVLLNLSTKDMYCSSWKFVQALADRFWARWRREYLHMIQKRAKWTDKCLNRKVGDVVLLKDNSVPRNEWPLAVVDEVYPS